jgi:uncharacterized repeat protein (TIGR01451 family)
MKAAHADRPLRWLRLLAIATGAVILASCRSLPTPAVVSTATVTMLPEPNPAATGAAPAAPAPPRTGDDASDWEADVRRADGSAAFGGIERTGLEAPCPALPRLEAAAPAGCRDGQCAVGICPPQVCIPCDRPPPLVGPYLVCDGGDACAPARPRGADGLANLTAGDTVARYRAAGDGPDAADVCIAVSNCACVYAPRFGSVRQVTQPHEEAKPVGPRGLALDTRTEARIDLQPVCRTTQWLAPEAARKALPGVALEERLGPLAVDQGGMPHESDGSERPFERVRDDQPERATLAEGPRTVTGFDVPLVWTCARSVMVMLGRQQAEVVAADRGTATLRLESPGRAELTLCKRAGTDTARVGEEIDFTIYLHNSGDRPLTDIVLVDALPGRLELVPNSAAANQPAEFVTDTGDDGSVVLKWQFQHTFKPGEGGFVRFRTLVR